MSTYRLADKREIEVDAPIGGGHYNVYGCPGPDATVPMSDPEHYLESATKHGLLSLDVDKGVTPMFVRCPDDGATAVSSMYPSGPVPTHLFPVRMIWRGATKGELKRERREHGDHYSRGGLAREWVTR